MTQHKHHFRNLGRPMKPSDLKLSDFQYHLPEELIARYPTTNRSDSRLLYLSQTIEHKSFADFPQLINEKDLLVFNNSRVITARLFARKETGGKVEILIERVLKPQLALAHIKANHSPRAGSYLQLIDNQQQPSKTYLQVGQRQGDLFALSAKSNFDDIMNELGHIPLPPYLNRQQQAIDCERYQTIYAQHKGSVAAPTAGLHFDQQTMDEIKKRRIDTSFVTLHVGAGTFQPVHHQDINRHNMHHEWIDVSQQSCDKIAQTKTRGGRVIAVGTTTVRCLETAKNQPYCGDTNIFITPGYVFDIVDMLLTNFHLPGSSLLMLVSAFAGHNRTLAAYQTAIKEKYRFYSYGDAMLIDKQDNQK